MWKRLGLVVGGAVGWAAGALVAAETVEFAGFATTSAATRFVLRDVSSGRNSEWLAVGGSFRGHAIESFDAKEQALVVNHGGRRIRLHLVDSRPPVDLSKYPYEDPAKLPKNRVTVVGAVAEEGSILPPPNLTVEAAIAAMGGFKPEARQTSIILMRPGSTRTADGQERGHLRMHMLDFSKEEDRGFIVQPGDTISVRADPMAIEAKAK